jgi:hypothetical protein
MTIVALLLVAFLIFAAIVGRDGRHQVVGRAVFIDTDFGSSSAPIMNVVTGKPGTAITGVMAEGWGENSSNWAEVRAECQVVSEEGEKFLRVDVTEHQSGWTQFKHELPDLEGAARYRLTVRLRNLSADFVEMGVRMVGLPYSFYWEKKDRFSTEWNIYQYDFVLPRIKREVGFWLVVRGRGTVDLASLKFERLEGTQELIVRLDRQHPDGGPANVFRNSRFPLGPQAGWMLGGHFAERERDDVQIAADPATTGPSGAPAMKIQGTEVSLYSEPFSPVYPLVEHQVGVAVRGSGTWHFLLRSGKEDIAHESL